MTTSSTNGDVVPVIYVHKHDAKRIKTILEESGCINKDYRMTPATTLNGCIAIPILSEPCDEDKTVIIIGKGKQFCPYSTSLLGNHLHRRPRAHNHENKHATTNLVQRALLQTIQELNAVQSGEQDILDSILDRIRLLSVSVCPKNLELLGDDGTLVVSRRALDTNEQEFISFLTESGVCNDDMSSFMKHLWFTLAALYKSPRIVRRGEVNPESGIRESGYRLLWPSEGIPAETGPGSPSWITVTEQGIRQSFDLTRVMFSRGNITEKIRFGSLVQQGEIVLDLYAGIGYFTLPALVHGEAEHLFACEWNAHAVEALRYNLEDNGVDNRATVIQGDCRVTARENRLFDMFDRVSLGLLPSSEGGWPAAVQAIRSKTGGWLHVHGNVPLTELDQWAEWVAWSLADLVRERGLMDVWAVVVNHVEKVKSFAPTINHYVCDIFIGPPHRLHSKETDSLSNGKIYIMKHSKANPSLTRPVAPSCALSENGVLNQTWMRK